MQTWQTAKTLTFFFPFKACGKPFPSGFDTITPPKNSLGFNT